MGSIELIKSNQKKNKNNVLKWASVVEICRQIYIFLMARLTELHYYYYCIFFTLKFPSFFFFSLHSISPHYLDYYARALLIKKKHGVFRVCKAAKDLKSCHIVTVKYPIADYLQIDS